MTPEQATALAAVNDAMRRAREGFGLAAESLRMAATQGPETFADVVSRLGWEESDARRYMADPEGFVVVGGLALLDGMQRSEQAWGSAYFEVTLRELGIDVAKLRPWMAYFEMWQIAGARP